MSYEEDKGYQISSQEGLTCLQIVKFAQTNFSFVHKSFCCFNWISNLIEDKDVINFRAKMVTQSCYETRKTAVVNQNKSLKHLGELQGKFLKYSQRYPAQLSEHNKDNLINIKQSSSILPFTKLRILSISEAFIIFCMIDLLWSEGNMLK